MIVLANIGTCYVFRQCPMEKIAHEVDSMNVKWIECGGIEAVGDSIF